MCEKCYSYIYDLIMTPLSTNHLLRGHIDEKALKRCSHEVSDCISRALSKYTRDAHLIHCMKIFKEAYETNLKVMDMIQRMEVLDVSKEHKYDEFMWNKFKETSQDDFKELNHAIQICMDNMVVKKIQCKEQLLEHFFMHKLRILLIVLPDIHKEHTEKKEYMNVKSLGSVPQYRINEIRRKAGLLVDEHVCISILGYDELYN
jgi:hypothetical protein